MDLKIETKELREANISEDWSVESYLKAFGMSLKKTQLE